MIGLPLEPSPLVTAIWLDVPVIVSGVSAAPLTANKPVPTVFASVRGKPLKESVGLPLMPLPLVRDRPEPLTANDRAVMVLAAVLTIMPVPALSNEAAVPLNEIV
jgi:hypothetical protein